MSEKKWIVSIPLAGFVNVYVSAPDKGSAKDMAWEQMDFTLECSGNTECGEIDSFETISQGNVFRGPLNRIEVIEDED
jgi:hypothetical protein